MKKICRCFAVILLAFVFVLLVLMFINPVSGLGFNFETGHIGIFDVTGNGIYAYIIATIAFMVIMMIVSAVFARAIRGGFMKLIEFVRAFIDSKR